MKIIIHTSPPPPPYGAGTCGGKKLENKKLAGDRPLTHRGGEERRRGLLVLERHHPPPNLLIKVTSERIGIFYSMVTRVADPHLFNADPNPSFHFNADPDPAPQQSDGNLRFLVLRPSMLHFEPPGIHL